MPSTLTWLDHDASARERSLRILALFQEKESRDELGLGAVRDAFADRLFPGTSTIQTRLRYMLFVPWIYARLEDERVPAAAIAARARKLEIALVDPLLAGDDAAGVLGRLAGGALKRLPSSVYWAGLGTWGIRRFDGSQEDYHRALDRIYARRDEREHRHRKDNEEIPPDPTLLAWHPRLPAPPSEFPDGVTFALSHEEAEFLLDRIVTAQKDSLLAHLALRCVPADVDFPWQHPDLAGFSPLHRELLDHARRFSEVMHGAALLYNLALAELAQRAELVVEHRANLAAWAGALDLGDLRRWSLLRLWELTVDQGHTITQTTRTFVQAWIELAATKPEAIADAAIARTLITQREQSLKKARSRFLNARARDQWSGYAGTGRLSFRWPTARSFLRDLHAGLKGG
ncbi:MAG: hypothetical protein IT372_37975 [Polyangiaceae bacterium]|nr:hypothetical protein [Polyangiaceae bacterium]